MHAVGYARISTVEQSHTSIENQCDGITAYCQRNNLNLLKIFIDRGRSAFTFDRPEWQNLESYLKKHKEAQYIIVYHLDRFSRATLLDALTKINELENKLKVKVLTVTDPVDLNTNDLGVQMLRTIGLLFSNNERQRIKERTTDGIYKSLSIGRFCSRPPIGYKRCFDLTGKPIMDVDDKAAPLIRMIFKLFNEGMNVEAILAEVRGQGYKQKGNSAIQRILSNCLYAGLVHIPPYKGQPERFTNGIHPPIITEHEFWFAFRKLKSRQSTIQPAEEVPLRGCLHCFCGRKFTAGNSKSKSGKYYWYYICDNHRKINLSANKLHAQLKEILNVLSFDRSSISWFREKITESIESSINNKGGDLMRAKLELQKVQNKIHATQERYLLQPDIAPEIYSKVMTDLKADESRLQNDIVQIQGRSKSLYEVMDDLLPKLATLGELFFEWNLHQQQLFINMSFGGVLFYRDNFYRTPYIHPLFADKVLKLKEKGLLLIENGSSEFVPTPISATSGSGIEHLLEFAKLFVA